MRLNEVFDSIQGEGLHAGRMMTFIRLQGCNLACKWCDTAYARSLLDLGLAATDLNSDQIEVHQEWVCITGGEPLIQADAVAALALRLRPMDKRIEVETNGSISPPNWAFMNVDLPSCDLERLIESWVVDIKLSSSGNPSSEKIIQEWAEKMRESDQFKLVLANAQDLEDAEDWLSWIVGYEVPILVSPALTGETLDVEWIQRVAKFSMKNKLRLSLQLHKVIWGNKRGV